MLFFQVLLLGGYAYAHFTSRWLKPRTQAIVHLVLLAAALALLPITPGDSWKPHGGGNPTLQILALLAVSLGLPYFVLSTTGPLIQQWFSRARPGRSPYRLYALSNVGSLLALVSYPFFFETHFTRKTQAGLWAWGLVAYVVCCGFCAVRLWKSEGRRPKVEGRPKSEGRNAKGGAGRMSSGALRMRRLLRLGTAALRLRPIRGAARARSLGLRISDSDFLRAARPRLSTLDPQPPPLASAAGLRLGAAAGDDQQAVPGRGGDSLSLGGAAGALPVELHHLLRQPALVCALPVHAGAHRRPGRLVLGAVQRRATCPSPSKWRSIAAGCSSAAWSATASFTGSSPTRAI